MFFHFIAGNQFSISLLDDVKDFINVYPDDQTVVLKDENELSLLLAMMKIPKLVEHNLESNEFEKFWDFSQFKLPELDEYKFEEFYREWIEASGRENNMDEYGNLIFLQGLSVKWNKLKFRLIVKDKVS